MAMLCLLVLAMARPLVDRLSWLMAGILHWEYIDAACKKRAGALGRMEMLKGG
jgi:hypothetical protein